MGVLRIAGKRSGADALEQHRAAPTRRLASRLLVPLESEG